MSMKSENSLFWGAWTTAAMTACVFVLTTSLGAGSAAAAAPPVTQVRLYALDCGHATFKDMAMFSDTGEYDGTTGQIADPCFVIVHPKGILIWDMGLGDSVAAHPEGMDPVILSGDLYHIQANRQFKRVPVLNNDRAATLASMDRIETLVKNKHARLIVQHDPQDFDALPKLPAYLD